MIKKALDPTALILLAGSSVGDNTNDGRVINVNDGKERILTPDL